MEKIVNQTTDWNFLSNLPVRAGGFILFIEQKSEANCYRIFTYKNDFSRRSFSVVYDKTTKEYLAKVVVGLTEFCDINYITQDLDKLEKVLSVRLEKTLQLLECSAKANLESAVVQKKIIDWPYAEILPQEVLGFELFIAPDRPVKVVNGSHIIIDYSDFETESGLIIYYNIFRDEFFGELRLRRTPVRTAAFDAKDIPELEDKLKFELKPALESVRGKI